MNNIIGLIRENVLKSGRFSKKRLSAIPPATPDHTSNQTYSDSGSCLNNIPAPETREKNNAQQAFIQTPLSRNDSALTVLPDYRWQPNHI